ncbi:hypothetical protein D9758_008442 [Tetrapyrgos nigripes]|uniref:Serine carboxypeptidase n=1 Tax=Tetrapyrgos nigripes TaxID=182062 RepID=A0A8H5FQG1_9AGAR|nr:hypothetical protein D9758_008442 [Tetrapyrgos nigripes]
MIFCHGLTFAVRTPMRFLTLAAAFCSLYPLKGLALGGAMQGMEDAMDIQREQLERFRDFLGPQVPPPFEKRQSAPTITFSNPAAQKFFVDGNSIPDVNFDAGPSWSGLMPISGDPNETRKLFFWFWPTQVAENGDKLLFWTNGGPGCSSLEGFIQENGPISWSWGQSEPTPNPFSWTRVAHGLWVEQPVGTGFSQGTPNITNDDELAAQLVGFLEQFLDVFSELKGKDFFLTGENVPYIANFIYEHPGSVDLNLKANKNVFPFNSSFWAELQQISDECGYTDYLDKFVTYPPAGQLPFPAGVIPGTLGQVSANCRSILGFPRDTQKFIYFNRTDVQDAIHAPHIEWNDCSDINVYAGNGRDQSIPSMLSVFPNVIEKSERTVVVHGLADFILVAEGTRIAIQNMTWSGKQGFQTPIEDESFTVKNFGAFGNQHVERGLAYVEFSFSGHMTPQFVPWAAFNTISYLVGLQDSPSS